MQSVSKDPSAKTTKQVSMEDALLLLLRGIQEHAAVAEEASGREFRKKLAAIERAFRGKENAHQVAEAAVATLAQYNAQVSESFARQRSELAKIAVETSAQGSPPAPAEVPLHDALTGLRTRVYAEGELVRAFQEAGDCFLAIFVLKRLALINAKFGFARGDQVLLKVVAHLAQALPDFRTFFRWGPCAFLTVAPAGMTFRELRSKVQIIELTRITPTLEWEGHNAMVPVALDCRVVSVKDFGAVSELFLRLDTFASDV